MSERVPATVALPPPSIAICPMAAPWRRCPEPRPPATRLGLSVASLCRNDPVYSLCVADIMAAPKSLHNQFIRDQRTLMENLQRLENQKVTRMRQLKEERQHFALVMRRRLAPSRPNTNHPSQASPWATRSGINLSLPTGAKGTSLQLPVQGRAVPHSQPKLPQVSNTHFSELTTRNTCTCSCQKLSRNARSLPNLQTATPGFEV